MVTKGRRADAALAETLQQAPWRFDFFQAVRLLEAQARTRPASVLPPAAAPVGHDHDPAREIVRFRAVLSRSFAASEIVRLTPGSDAAPARPPAMYVAFMGLTGPAGVLPESYLDLLQQRVREKDYALRDFFDLFNHRTVSLFYRAWEKYRLRFGLERALRDGEGKDDLTRILDCLVGRGTAHQDGRLSLAAEHLRRYAGHFAHFPRSAVALQAVLSDHFRLPVRLQQFIGRWLTLEDEQRSRLPSAVQPAGQFNRLGVDTVVGERVWDVQSKFRLRLGPMRYADFHRFLPTAQASQGRSLATLLAFTRSYVGLEKDFDIRLVLAAAEVPGLRLGHSRDFEPHLGWNTWLGTARHRSDRDDCCFDADR